MPSPVPPPAPAVPRRDDPPVETLCLACGRPLDQPAPGSDPPDHSACRGAA